MSNHLERKYRCKPILNIIDTDELKEYILDGLNYNEYLENIKYFKSQLNVSQKSVKIKQQSANSQSNESKINDNKYECEFCNKQYIHKQSLHKHLKICKEKKKDDEVKESMIELVKILNQQNNDLKQQLGIQNKQIQELIKKAGINNSTINVQNNIKLLGYGDTDRSHLTDKDILKCLKHSNFCVPYLIEKVHFDANKPENHNVYISNLRNKYVMIYDGNKWKCKDREEQIGNLIDDNQGVLEYKLEEWLENGKNYPDAMKKFNRYIEKRDNDKVINKIKEEIKLLLYNNRNVVNKDLFLENK